MTSTTGRRTDVKSQPQPRIGLFRTILAGSGHTLADAFASLEQAPQVEQINRHLKRGLVGARVTLPPDEGKRYWDLTQIRDDIYVVVANFRYKEPRVELVPGDDLVQFNFKLSGDMSLAVSRTEPLRWNSPSLLVWAQPSGIDVSEWTAASARERFIIVSVRPEFLIEHFLSSGADSPQQLQAFLSNKREKVIYSQRPLSSQTFEVTTRLIDDPFSGTVGLVYTEALALELLCCAVQSFVADAPTPVQEYTERELKCLYLARKMLMTQLSPPRPSPSSPARSGWPIHPDQGFQDGVRRDHLGLQPQLPDAPRTDADARPALVGRQGERGGGVCTRHVLHDGLQTALRHATDRRSPGQIARSRAAAGINGGIPSKSAEARRSGPCFLFNLRLLQQTASAMLLIQGCPPRVSR